MNIIEPTIEVWNQGKTIDDIWEHIAKCARVCYQSENKKNELGCDFINRVILKNYTINKISNNKDIREKLHLSVLEHGTIYLTITDENCFADELCAFFRDNPYSRIIDDGNNHYITTNMRVIIENGMDYCFDLITERTFHKQRHTVSITTSIGAIRDTNRHRKQSISEESTRYCLYTGDRFGSQITFTQVPWIEYDKDKVKEIINCRNAFYGIDAVNEWSDLDWYFHALATAELAYNKLVEQGWTAQMASNVLPLNTKTQSVHTAFDDDWEHYLHLRYNEVSGKVRPEVKHIAELIKNAIDKSNGFVYCILLVRKTKKIIVFDIDKDFADNYERLVKYINKRYGYSDKEYSYVISNTVPYLKLDVNENKQIEMI